MSGKLLYRLVVQPAKIILSAEVMRVAVVVRVFAHRELEQRQIRRARLAIQYIDPETNAIRSYYPDFITTLDDGTIQIIEVKGDNKIDNSVVLAKAAAASEMASASKMEYLMLASTRIMKEKVV